MNLFYNNIYFRLRMPIKKAFNVKRKDDVGGHSTYRKTIDRIFNL